MRLSSGILLILLLGFAAIAGRLATGIVPLDWAASALTTMMERSLPSGVLVVEGAGLRLSETNKRLQLDIARISFRGHDGYHIEVQDIALQPNIASLFIKWRLAADSLVVEQLHITGEAEASQRPPENLSGLGKLIALATGGNRGANTLRELEIKFIDLRHVEDAPEHTAPSFVVWRRDAAGATLDLKLDYMSGKAPALIQAQGKLVADEISRISYRLENVKPSDLALFVPALAAFRQQTFPISASGEVFVHDVSRVEGTNLSLKIGSGQLQTSGDKLRLESVELELDVDAINQSVLVGLGEFSIGDQSARFAGLLDYALDQDGSLSRIGGELTSTSFGFRFPGDTTTHFGQSAAIDFTYFATNDVFDIRAARADVAGVSLSATGRLELAGKNRDITNVSVDADLNAAEIRSLLKLWPPKAGSKTRSWVDENVLAGNLKKGKVVFQGDTNTLEALRDRNRPTPEAIAVELVFEEAKLRAHSALPDLQKLAGKVLISGHNVVVEVDAGEINLASDDQVDGAEASPVIGYISDGKFVSPPFFAPSDMAQVNFKISAPLTETLSALDKPPFSIMKNLPFTPGDVAGGAIANVQLSIPMGPEVTDRTVLFEVEARTTSTALDISKYGYAVKNSELSLSVNPRSISFEGMGEVNGVPMQINGKTFGPEDERTLKLQAETRLTPVMAGQLHLGFLSQMFSQSANVNSVIEFLRTGEREIKFKADLSATQLHPKHISYIKEPSQPAQVEGVVRMEAGGALSSLSASYQAANDQVKVDIAAKDGYLVYVNVPVFKLADRYDFSLSTEAQGESAVFNLVADRFDISKLLKHAPPPPLPMIQPVGAYAPAQASPHIAWPLLPKQYSVAARITEIRGAHDVVLGPVLFSAVSVDGKVEKGSVMASFSDGTELYGELFRDQEDTRRFLIQSEDAANIFVGLDLVPQMKGGALSVTGDIYDDPIELENGRLAYVKGTYSLAAFKIQKVPVLAQLLSLASLTGLSDTLSGSGLRFSQATGDFTYFEGRTEIQNSIIRGPSIGVTARGAIDHDLGLLAIGGTLVPAYSINSLFRKIPVLGPVLGGAKGEGILGVSYRISGLVRDPSVAVNPLSVLTPGFIRQIFQIGAGTILPPDQPSETLEDGFPDR